jgi:hypothetical protein
LFIGKIAHTAGYTTKGDGGENLYEIVAAATGTADGGLYIDLTGTGLQAKGLFPKGFVNLRQYGATGASDDTASVVAALASGYKDIRGVDGDVYIIDTATSIGVAGVTLDLKGSTFKQKLGSQTGNWLSITAADGFTFKNYRLDGNRIGVPSLHADSALLTVYNTQYVSLLSGRVFASSAKGVSISSGVAGSGTKNILVDKYTGYDCSKQCLLTDRSNGGVGDTIPCEDVVMKGIFIKDTDHAGVAINDGSRRVTLSDSILDVNNATWDALSIRGSREVSVANVIGRRGRNGCQISVLDAAALSRGEDSRNITFSNNIWEENDQSGLQIVGAINVNVSGDIGRNNAQGGTGSGINVSQVAGVRRSSYIRLSGCSGIDDQTVATQEYGVQVAASDDVKVDSPTIYGNVISNKVHYVSGVTEFAVSNDSNDGATHKIVSQTTGSVVASSFATVTINFATPFVITPNWANAEVLFGSSTSYLRVQKVVALTTAAIQVQVKNDHTLDATGTLYAEVRHLN